MKTEWKYMMNNKSSVTVYKNAFNYFDDDRDGKITLENLRDGAHTLGMFFLSYVPTVGPVIYCNLHTKNVAIAFPM